MSGIICGNGNTSQSRRSIARQQGLWRTYVEFLLVTIVCPGATQTEHLASGHDTSRVQGQASRLTPACSCQTLYLQHATAAHATSALLASTSSVQRDGNSAHARETPKSMTSALSTASLICNQERTFSKRACGIQVHTEGKKVLLHPSWSPSCSPVSRPKTTIRVIHTRTTDGHREATKLTRSNHTMYLQSM